MKKVVYMKIKKKLVKNFATLLTCMQPGVAAEGGELSGYFVQRRKTSKGNIDENDSTFIFLPTCSYIKNRK